MRVFSIFFICICVACSSHSNQYSEILDTLKDGEVYADFTINNNEFYSSKNGYIGSFTVGSDFIKLALSDSFESNVQLELTKPDWFQEDKPTFFLSPNPIGKYINYGNFLIGKRKQGGYEGYMLSKADVVVESFEREFVAIKFKGFVVNPGSALIEANEIPFEGIIVSKQPFFVFDGIKEDEIL